jgi:hypothetical protein
MSFDLVLANERNPEKVECRQRNRCRNIDVIDDYMSEQEEVLRKQGRDFKYTPGDNIARFLLGSIYLRYDNMDEKFVE